MQHPEPITIAGDKIPVNKLLYFFGAGGHAAVCADVATDAGWELSGIFADSPPTRFWRDGLFKGPYRNNFEDARPCFLALGGNTIRKKVAAEVDSQFVTLVHPSALVSANGVEILHGSVLMHGSIVQAGVRIGQHVIVNTAASIDHDCTIGAFAHIAPGVRLCGGVEIGEGALIGVGAVVAPGIKIGAWARVGAGAAVVRNVAPGATVVGVPAK
jgi:sugar O-acyltransferase (sialic acid O-acetyltransferase NeuD family)